MKIKLYNTRSTNNTIGKVLTDELETEIRLKSATNIKTPIVLLFSENFPHFNYAWLDDFNRYYFITNIESFPNHIYQLTLSIDVLETYKTDILNSSGFISKQETINPYYNTDYESEIKKEVDIYKSDTKINVTARNNVLITLGGV